jgi:nitrite reductase/ring-hydroxylating ferredoxin subunit
MFKNPTKILSHVSAIEESNFVTLEYILNKNDDTVNLFRRICPHRSFPLGAPGETVDNIICKFHGYEWDKQGNPTNNNRRLNCGQAEIGRSGLVFQNFVEPNHQWVTDLSNETDLEYSHSMQGTSTGSWLWMMEIQADLLHVRKGGVHPDLSEKVNLDNVNMFDGDGWILQTCETGWWLFVYPFTFIEWSTGCVSINYTVPNDIKNEFGFKWITQFYYSKNTSFEKRKEFETLEDVFHEDVETIEMQVGKYFPLLKTNNRLENHCVHFGRWIMNNLKDPLVPIDQNDRL